MTARWHADDALLARYVRADADALDAASAEQHLLHCPQCRARTAAYMDAAPLELVWRRIEEQAQAPAPGLVARLLRRLGLPDRDALLVAAAPTLRTSWLAGLVVTLGFVALAAEYGGDRGLILFLLVAPLVPVAGVAYAYGPDADPLHELSVAAPYPSARLLLLRAAAVLTASLPLVLAAALVQPALSSSALLWLVPALALTAGTLTASTWVRPTRAAGVFGAAWLGAVASAAAQRDPAAVLALPLLLAYTVLGVAALLVLVLRVRQVAAFQELS